MRIETSSLQSSYPQRLMQFGLALFILGLLTGFLLPLMANARMGLSSHLEGIMNGLVLVVLGLLWPRLQLGAGSQKVAYYLALYGTYTNWAATLLAGFIGAGGTMMPLAAAEFIGSGLQEGLITLALMSLSIAMLIVGGMALWGVSRNPVAD